MESRHACPLALNLDAMEKNIATMQSALKVQTFRPPAHQDAQVRGDSRKYQLATGSIGICCAKLSEAEAMVAHGVDKILLTTSNPSPSKSDAR